MPVKALLLVAIAALVSFAAAADATVGSVELLEKHCPEHTVPSSCREHFGCKWSGSCKVDLSVLPPCDGKKKKKCKKQPACTWTGTACVDAASSCDAAVTADQFENLSAKVEALSAQNAQTNAMLARLVTYFSDADAPDLKLRDLLIAKALGASAADLKMYFSLPELTYSWGYSAAELMAAGFPLADIKQEKAKVGSVVLTTKAELQKAIDDGMSGIEDWDVSLVKEFSYLFYYAEKFNADLSKWDVAQGMNFNNMFYGAEKFNADLSKWNVAKGFNFAGMFAGASSFNADLSKWNVAKGTSFNLMFLGASSFDADLSEWNVAQGTYFDSMFSNAESFNADLSEWNVAKGTNFEYMFAAGASSFNADLSEWNVAKGTNFESMFAGAKCTSPNCGCDGCK